MTMACWGDDLGVVEKRFQGDRKLLDLPVSQEDWRVPGQGSISFLPMTKADPGIGLRARVRAIALRISGLLAK